MLTGFEDNSVAVRIRDTKNVRAADCTLEPAGIPARTGHRSIKAQIGATVKGAEIGCSLLFSEAVPFTQAKAVAAYVCLYEGEVSLAFRVRDDQSTGSGTATVNIAGFDSQVVQLKSTGRTVAMLPAEPSLEGAKQRIQMLGDLLDKADDLFTIGSSITVFLIHLPHCLFDFSKLLLGDLNRRTRFHTQFHKYRIII